MNWQNTLDQWIANNSANPQTNESWIAVIPGWAALTVSGTDAEKFLQGQVSADVSKICVNSAQLCAFCNAKGRIRSLFFLCRLEDRFLLVMPKEILQFSFNEFKKYAAFFKAQLDTADDGYLLAGSSEHSLPANLNTTALPINGYSATLYWVSEAELAAQLNHDDTNSWCQQLVNADVWESFLVEHQCPRLYQQTVEQFLPHNLNLQLSDAISFTKGCFTGQEIIARMQYKGSLKSSLHKAWLHSEEFPGTAIAGQKILLEGKNVGEIVSIAPAPQGQNTAPDRYALLVHLKDSVAETEKMVVEFANRPILTLQAK